MTIDELKVVITAKTTDLQKEIDKAKANLKGLGTAATTVGKQINTGLNSASMGKVKAEMNAGTQSARILAKNLSAVTSAGSKRFSFDGLKAGLNGIRNHSEIVFKNMGEKLKKSMSGALSSIKSGFTSFFSLIGKAAKLAIVAVIATAATGFNKVVEMNANIQNLSRSLGENASQFTSWAKTQALAYGLSEASAIKYGSTFANLVSGFTANTTDTTALTEQLLTQSAVIASQTGRTVEDVMERMRSGMLGNTESVEDLGVYASQSAIESTNAFKQMGVAWNDLSSQQKQQVITLGLLEQSSSKYGNTLAGGLSTQIMIFKARLGNLQTALGQCVIPIATVVLPYLSALVNGLSTAANYVAAFLSALFGIKSDSTKDLANSTKDISKNVGSAATGANSTAAGLNNAAKAAAKAKKSLMGFDQLNQLAAPETADSSGSGGTGGGGGIASLGLEVADVDTSKVDGILSGIQAKASAFATKLKNDFGKIDFTPLMTSLGNLKTAFAPFGKAIGDGLKWVYDEVLLPLATFAIEDVIPAFINLLSGALNFLAPILALVQAPLQWLWDNFLVPIASWTGGTIVTIINGIATALTAVGTWMANNKVLMEDIAIVIGSIATAFGLVTLAMNLGNIAMGIWAVISGIGAVVTSALGAAFVVLTSPITLVILAIAAVIAIVVLCIKHWDDIKLAGAAAWEWIKAAWVAAGTWFNTTIIIPIVTFFTGLWTSITTGASAAWTGIKTAFSGIGTWFSGKVEAVKGFFTGLPAWFSGKFTSAYTNIKSAFASIGTFFSGIWTGIKGAFASVGTWFKDTFSKAWTAVKNVFATGGKIFDGIKDGISGVFKTVVNGLIGGINKVISVPFTKINGMLNTIRNVSILGAKPFSGLWGQNPLSIPSIPKLAKGGIVDSAQMFIAGEAGKEVIMPLENNTGWIKQLAGQINSQNGSGGLTEAKLEKAFVSALNKVNTGDTVLYLGNQEVARAANKGNKIINRRYSLVTE